MTLGLIYWILMLLWLVLGIWQSWPNVSAVGLGGTALMFLLLLILGWATFGAPIRG